MKIEVLYFADLKDIAGLDKEIFEINRDLKDLINKITEKYPAIKSLIIEDNTEDMKKSIQIAINDEIVKNNESLSLPLSEGDRLALLLPLSGG